MKNLYRSILFICLLLTPISVSASFNAFAAPAIVAANAPPLGAERTAAIDRTPDIDAGSIKEPTTTTQEVQLAVAFLKLLQIAVRTGTLAAFALAGLALAYLLMYLVKTGIKGHVVPEKYIPAMKASLALLTIAISALGYFAGGGGATGMVTAGVVGLGAAASMPAHRMIDGIANKK